MAHSLDEITERVTAAEITAAATRYDGPTRRRLATHAARATRARIGAHPNGDDAEQVARLEALALAGRPESEGWTVASIARVAAVRVQQALTDTDSRSRETASGLAEDLATYETEPRARLIQTALPDPDGIASEPSGAKRAALAMTALNRTRPDLARLLTWSTYLPMDDGRAWRSGRPAARLLLELLGAPVNGRTRAVIGPAIALACHALAEHYDAQRRHREAGTNLHAHHGTRARTAAAPSPRRGRWTPETAALAAAAVDRLDRYGNRDLPTSGRASLVVVTDANGQRHALMNDGTRVTLGDADDPETTTRVAAVLLLPLTPTHTGGTVGEQTALDLFASTDTTTRSASGVTGVRPGIKVGNTVAGSGAAPKPKRPSSRRRKRDGGIGGPMTR